MEKLLTIVVPAYNVEKYIKNCLDSFIDLSVLISLEILIAVSYTHLDVYKRQVR